MKILKLWLDGYGCFTGREVELAPGLQVVFGPNEQGKTTIRSFIGDMLYGQKASPTRRQYDDAHELRRPWNSPECYRGRIWYVLDDRREIEVHRTFHRKQESVQVFDRTHGEEITSQFSRLPNREPTFAEQHVGLTKAVFLNTATIGHLTLEDLGDDDALAQIREKILSLADSAEEGGSAEAALQLIEERIAAIGRPAPNSKRPLPASRARLAELEQEYARARELRADLAECEARRHDLHARVRDLEQRRNALDDEQRLLENQERANRLAEVERLTAEVESATQQCFSLSSVREFPLEQTPDVQRAANAAETARVQLERTRKELDEARRQADDELARMGADASVPIKEIPDDWDERLAKRETDILQLRDRVEEIESNRDAIAARLKTAEDQMARVPDFSRMDVDPLESLTHATTSFSLLIESRNRQRDSLARLRDTIARRQRDIEERQRVFVTFPDFGAEVHEYEEESRQYIEQHSEVKSRIEQSEAILHEHRRSIPASRALAVMCAAALLGVLTIIQYRPNQGLYVAAVFVTLIAVYFFARWFQSHFGVRRRRTQLGQMRAELAGIEQHHQNRTHAVKRAVAQTGCQTLRELEALYDRYCHDTADLVGLHSELDRQVQRTQDEDQQAARVFSQLQETFSSLGQQLERETEVPNVFSSAIGLYQEYREAKRRLLDTREQSAMIIAQFESVRAELRDAEKDERDLSIQVRRLLSEAGYTDHRLHASARKALHSYRIRTAQAKQKRGRVDVVQERVKALLARIEAEERDLQKQQTTVGRYLRMVDADSIDTWHRLAEQAKVYREAWGRRTTLQQQIDTLLQGAPLAELRQGVEADGPAPGFYVPRRADEARLERQRAAEDIEALSKEEHALHIAITERTAATRSLSEIEEERADVQRRVAQLEGEMDAAAYAASLIDEVARDKHARIAPQLAALASQYLNAITGGAYSELFVNRDLGISVRIPQTQKLNEGPERQLSTGTTDQIYLALRLALVRALSEVGESVPMLLDDPFANYDDERLARALALVQHLAEDGQFILFTCRDDVARIAQSIGAPVLRL